MSRKEVEGRFPIGKEVTKDFLTVYYVCDLPQWDSCERKWRIPVCNASGEYVASFGTTQLKPYEECEDSDAPPAGEW